MTHDRRSTWTRRPSTEVICAERNAESDEAHCYVVGDIHFLRRAIEEGNFDPEYAAAVLGWNLQLYSARLKQQFEHASMEASVAIRVNNDRSSYKTAGANTQTTAAVSLGHEVASAEMMMDPQMRPVIDAGLLNQMLLGTLDQRYAAIRGDHTGFEYGARLPGFSSQQAANYASDAAAYGLWMRIRRAALQGADQSNIDALFDRVTDPALKQIMQEILATASHKDLEYSLRLNEENDWNGDRRSRRERRVGRFRKAVAGLAAVAATSVVLPHAVGALRGEESNEVTSQASGSSNESNESDPREQARSEKGVCLTPEALELLETDCYKLPRLRDVAEFELTDKAGDKILYDKSTVIGSIRNGRMHLDRLPAEYAAAFEAALSDPFVKKIAKTTPIIIRQSNSMYDENGYYSPYYDRITIVFSVDDVFKDQKDRLYPTWGSIRTVLVHEGAHKIYGKAARARDRGKSDPDMNRLDRACVADLRASARGLSGKLMPKLDKLEDILDSLDISEEVRLKVRNNINTLRAAEDYPRMIPDLTVFYEKTPQYLQSCELVPISYSLSEGLSETEYEALSNADRKLGKKDDDNYQFMFAQSELDSVVNNAARRVFASRQDGAISNGVSAKYAGHSWENVNERFASTTANIQINPDGYIQAVLELPSERARRSELTFIESTYRILDHRQPGAVDETNFDYVIDTLRAQIAE